MTAPDLFRAVMISLAALLISTVLFGTYTAWRDRYTPVPRRAPFASVVTFVIGYVLLLAELMVARWENLGSGINPSAIVAMIALVLNVVAMVMLVRSAQPPSAPTRKRRHP